MIGGDNVRRFLFVFVALMFLFATALVPFEESVNNDYVKGFMYNMYIKIFYLQIYDSYSTYYENLISDSQVFDKQFVFRYKRTYDSDDPLLCGGDKLTIIASDAII